MMKSGHLIDIITEIPYFAPMDTSLMDFYRADEFGCQKELFTVAFVRS